MADTPRTTAPSTEPLRIVESEVAGYCDPATGMCVWPGAPTIAPTSNGQSPDEPEFS